MVPSSRKLWNEEYLANPPRSVMADPLLKELVEELTPGTALDLGCGVGQNAFMLARRGWQVTGVDWADAAIDIARRDPAYLNGEVQFIVADATEWVPPSRFDLVISAYSLPGGEGTARALQNAANSVATGGTVIIAEWDRSMAEIWGLAVSGLPTPAEIAALLPGIEIDFAGVRELPMSEPSDPRGSHGRGSRVALVVGKGIAGVAENDSEVSHSR